MWVYSQYYTILTILYRKCMYRQHTDTLMWSALLRETAGINCPHWPWRWRCLHPWLPWRVSASQSSPGLPGNQTWRGTAAHTLQPQHSCITGRKQPASHGSSTKFNFTAQTFISILTRNLCLNLDQNRLYGATPGDSCLDLVPFVTQLICHQ